MEKKQCEFTVPAFSYPAQIEMLAAGGCPALLPVDVMETDGRVRLFYQVADMRRLDSWESFTAGEALSLIEGLLEMMETLRRWLWFPEEYRLAPDTVYVDGGRDGDGSGYGYPKLLYVPDREGGDEQEKLLHLLDYIHARTGQTGQIYLESLRTLLTSEGIRPDRIAAFIDELLIEVRTLGLF